MQAVHLRRPCIHILRLRATLAGPVQLVRHYYTRVMRASLSTSFDLERARSYSTPRRSACVVAPTIGRHVLLSTSSGHFNLLRFFWTSIVFFYVDTCCVWGGFGRFRPASTWRHNPVPFISQVPGGYYTGNTPPFIPVFALFIFRLLQTANRRPRPPDSYIIPLRSDSSSEDSSSVVNGLFFVVSFADSLFLA